MLRNDGEQPRHFFQDYPIGGRCMWIAVRLICGALLLGGASARAQQAMPTVELSVGMHRIEAEVAATQDHRATGLMRRREMLQ